MGAGHGGASGRYDALRETAFNYAFMLWQMGIAPLQPGTDARRPSDSPSPLRPTPTCARRRDIH